MSARSSTPECQPSEPHWTPPTHLYRAGRPLTVHRLSRHPRRPRTTHLPHPAEGAPRQHLAPQRATARGAFTAVTGVDSGQHDAAAVATARTTPATSPTAGPHPRPRHPATTEDRDDLGLPRSTARQRPSCWRRCRATAWGRCGCACRGGYRDRPPRRATSAAHRRCADQSALLQKTLRGLSCGGNRHA